MDTIAFVSGLRQQALLLGDYNAYRQLCSRRLAKLRKRLGRATDPKKKDVKSAPKVTVEELNSDPTYAHLYLFSSERAWAHAMYMKSFNTDTSEPPTRATRDHIRSRLTKSLHYATELSNLYLSPLATSITDKDILEVTAYAATLSGALCFEKSAWEDALKEFSLAKVVYDTLILEQEKGADIYKEFLTSSVEPSIKYSAYQVGIPRNTDIGPLARHFFPRERGDGGRVLQIVEKRNPEALSASAAAGGVASVDEMEGVEKTTRVDSVSWRGRTAAIEDTDLAVSLGVAQAAEKELYAKFEGAEERKHTPEDFDAVLLAWQESVDEAKKAIDKATSEGLSAADQRLQKLQLVFTYVNYNLIGWRIGRNRVLAKDIESGASGRKEKKARKTKTGEIIPAPVVSSSTVEQGKLKELLVLYDAILQSIDQINELPGVAADEDFGTELLAKKAFFSALRCSTIAASHTATNTRNALALYNRALEYINKSLNSLPAPTSSAPARSHIQTLSIDSNEAHALKASLEGSVARYRALIQLQDYAAKTSNAKSPVAAPPVIDNLGRYSEKVDFGRLVPLPPKVDAVPLKPIFFDVAWNFVAYPGEEKTVEVAEEQKADEGRPAKKGGFLGGLFGR